MTPVQIEEAFGPLDEKILESHEASWQIRLPEAYRLFLLKYNGGSPVPDCFNFQGSKNGSDLRYFLGINNDYHTDLLRYLQTLKHRLPARFFPIGYDSGGNIICISVAGDDLGKVYFWDHEREAEAAQSPELAKNTILIADSFQEFLEGLYEYQEVK